MHKSTSRVEAEKIVKKQKNKSPTGRRDTVKNRQKPPNKTVKKSVKNRSEAEPYSASEAARLLGVSIPTLKRMAGDGQVHGFKTPGGHLRILGESIAGIREQRPKPRPVRDPSPVLHNRRERLEELTLEAQELRAKRELEKLRREEAEEAERREAEAEEREREEAKRQEAFELEQARFERQQAQEQERCEADEQLAAFRCRWLERVTAHLLSYEFHWLSAAQRKEILNAMEAEIAKRRTHDEPRMMQIVTLAIAALVEPFAAERQARERNNRIVEDTLRRLSWNATDAERTRAAAAIRESLTRRRWDAGESALRATAEEAMRTVSQTVQKRLLDERLIRWAVWELPSGSTDGDKARLRRECAEILAELPEDVSQAEAKEALEPTVGEVSQEIEERQASKRREQRKVSLIQQGVAEVSRYLWFLKQDGGITAEEYRDSDFTADLKQTVKEELEQELTGEETGKEIEETVHEMIDAELE